MKSTGSNDRANGSENAADERGEEGRDLRLHLASGQHSDTDAILNIL